MRTPRLYKDKYKLGMNKYRNFCSKSVFLKKGMKKKIYVPFYILSKLNKIESVNFEIIGTFN